MHKLLRWLDARFPLLNTWKRYASDYYVANNLNVYYCFGALAILVLLNQLLSGIWLTMFYTPSVKQAFDSVESIMRDVNYGWLLRYLHSTGASALFLVLYVHMFRGLLYGSYQKPRELVWLIGMALFVLMMMEAFFGYLLPWGQLSFWGAQVVTSLFSAVPYIGDHLVIWLRGDFAVGDPTLHRFFALHVIAVPLLILLFVFLHVISIHQVGSNNPQGIEIEKHRDIHGKPLDGVPFYPYYVWKDGLAAIIFSIVFFAVVFFVPDMGGLFLEPLNVVPADRLVTPEHITPLWYLSPFYAMLRAIPHKSLGIFVAMMGLWLLVLIPWLDKSPVKAMRYKGWYSKVFFTGMIVSFITLGYLGRVEPGDGQLLGARIATGIYFLYFLLMPVYTRFERHKIVPDRTGL